MNFDFIEEYEEGERVYGPLNSGLWFEAHDVFFLFCSKKKDE